GWERPDDLLGRAVDEIVHPDDRARFSGDREALRSSEVRLFRRDGGAALVEIDTLSATFDRAPALVALCRDQTGRRQLEVQLRHAQKLESVGRLASGIAHEINTPIQFIGDNVAWFGTAFERLFRLC